VLLNIFKKIKKFVLIKLNKKLNKKFKKISFSAKTYLVAMRKLLNKNN